MFRVRFLLYTAYVLLFSAMGIQVAFATQSLLAVGYGAAFVGSLWALRSFGTIFAPAFFGALADAIAKRRGVTVFCVSVGGLAFLSLAFAGRGVSAWWGFGLYGLIGSASLALLDGLTLRFLHDDPAGYSRFRMFGSSGFGITVVVASLIFRNLEVTPERVFGFSAVVVMLAALALALLPRDNGERALRESVFVILKRRFVVLLSLVGVFFWASFGAYTAFLQPVAARIGGDAVVVGGAVFCAISSEVVALLFAKRVLARFGEWNVVCFALVVSALRWLLLSQCEDTIGFVLLQLLNGLSFGFFYTAAVQAIAKRTPKAQKQAAQGFFFSAYFGVGGMIGTYVAGALIEWKSAQEALLAMTGFSVLSLLTFLIAIRKSELEGEALE